MTVRGMSRHNTPKGTQIKPGKFSGRAGRRSNKTPPAASVSFFTMTKHGSLDYKINCTISLKFLTTGKIALSMIVSPLNETNQYVYDGNNNLIYSIDPLGFTNQSVYDNQNNQVKTIDPRGNPSTFGYNAQFSLTGQTNGVGDFITFVFQQ